jgi:hypothetical protein
MTITFLFVCLFGVTAAIYTKQGALVSAQGVRHAEQRALLAAEQMKTKMSDPISEIMAQVLEIEVVVLC